MEMWPSILPGDLDLIPTILLVDLSLPTHTLFHTPTQQERYVYTNTAVSVSY